MSLKSTLCVLVEARRLISVPGSWTKGAVARDKEGEALGLANSRRACRWCAVGAVYRAHAQISDGTVFDDVNALRALSEVIAPQGNPNESAWLNTISSVNDAELTRHKDVLDIFDAAISAVRKRMQQNRVEQAAVA